MHNIENLLPGHGVAIYYERFFNAACSDVYLRQLQEEICWRQEPIKLFGREVLQPRLTALYGEPGKPYTYSGRTMHPLPWTQTLLEIKQQVEPVAGVIFSTALLNFYRDGSDSMGWHRDNERSLGPDPVIGSLSFGATRKFQFRDHKDKKNVHSIGLANGSFLLMKGETQKHWEHRLPKTTRPIGPRINITFRVIVD
jgi:alkylated DNA repair dioxygenase AlkB